MPASDGLLRHDLDAAAAGLRRRSCAAPAGRTTPDAVPSFDVVLLGLGPDGHCASLFPDHPGAYDESGPVIAVRNSPKPPPQRMSLSFDGLDAANEIWFVASGAGKAEAVALALSGAAASKSRRPGRAGKVRTLWLVDRDAAAGCPAPDGCPSSEPAHRRTLAAVGSGLAAAGPQPGQRLFQDRVAVGVASGAPSRRPGASCTARCAARPAAWPTRGRPGSRSAGSPRCRAPAASTANAGRVSWPLAQKNDTQLARCGLAALPLAHRPGADPAAADRVATCHV